jgi:hypothetical protein
LHRKVMPILAEQTQLSERWTVSAEQSQCFT